MTGCLVRHVVVVVFLALFCFVRPADGADQSVYRSLAGQTSYDLQQFEIFSGADLTRNSWLAYAGGTWTPWGQYYEQGPRLRFYSAYAHYGFGDLLNFEDPRDFMVFREKGSQFDLMVGYGFVKPGLSLNIYLGASRQENLVLDNSGSEGGYSTADGIKGQFEIWYNLGSKSWVSGYGSLSSVSERYSAQIELGYRVLSWVSFGVEGKVSGDEFYREKRVGAFMDIYWGNMDFGLVTGQAYSDEYDSRSYLMLNTTSRF